MIFEKHTLEARVQFIKDHQHELEACIRYMLTSLCHSNDLLQEYQKNITDAENIYLAHDRRVSDDTCVHLQYFH